MQATILILLGSFILATTATVYFVDEETGQILVPNSGSENYGNMFPYTTRQMRKGREVDPVMLSKKAVENTRAISGHMLKQPLLKFDVLWRKFGGNKRFTNT